MRNFWTDSKLSWDEWAALRTKWLSIETYVDGNFITVIHTKFGWEMTDFLPYPRLPPIPDGFMREKTELAGKGVSWEFSIIDKEILRPHS